MKNCQTSSFKIQKWKANEPFKRLETFLLFIINTRSENTDGLAFITKFRFKLTEKLSKQNSEINARVYQIDIELR